MGDFSLGSSPLPPQKKNGDEKPLPTQSSGWEGRGWGKNNIIEVDVKIFRTSNFKLCGQLGELEH